VSATQDLVIGWIAPSTCSTLFAASLTKALLDDRVRGRICDVVTQMSGPLIAQARTTVVDTFLTTNAQWLLQIDSDMVFEPADILALLEAADAQDRPIIGALYVGTNQGAETLEAEAGWHVPGGIGWVAPQRAAGLVLVDFVGAGALLVHRRVYGRLATLYPRPQPWFAEVARWGQVYGEDGEFCHRAKAAGYPIHVHADVRIGHVKTVVLRPEPNEGKP